MPAWLNQLLPIVLLLAAVFVVLSRLPRVDLGHSPEYRRRRFLNWFPLGLTYAFLYMGRYNLSATAPVLDHLHLLSGKEYGDVRGWGSAVYGIAFLLNGPLTDRWGGRVTILISAIGAALMNALMGVALMVAADGSWPKDLSFASTLTLLYVFNMYFQSFGAVSIVKVNAPWFHVRERGVLGGVFGILISLGLYFAFDWCAFIAKELSVAAAFWVPAAILGVFAVIGFLLIQDTPSKAGHKDFDTGDAVNQLEGENPSVFTVAARMFSQPVILIIVAIEFCSGFLRTGVMDWYKIYAEKLGYKAGFVATNWGMLLCVAGILGGVFAGFVSDHVFGSRRGPVAAVLYGGLIFGAGAAALTIGTPALGACVLLMSLCVIGVHGMLSGTASMDFGGRKNAGVVTGIIDGFVYFGTAAQAFFFGRVLPQGDAAKIPAEWVRWPLTMLPVAILGLVLATRVWNARPRSTVAPAKPSGQPALNAPTPG